MAAKSDATGSAQLAVHGHEGDSFELEIRCPPPLRSPETSLVIRRLSIVGGAPEHLVRCEETRRLLVVAIRAENGPNLPILHLGREIGRTDSSGAAHLQVDVAVDERIEFSLDTKGAEMVGVHPQNPTATFEPSERDEVRVFAVTFKRDPKPRVAPARRQTISKF